jgi:4-hydroxybutyryl-CoA dehydratase/vinylacetyl-CoA-Delta-isomerase
MTYAPRSEDTRHYPVSGRVNCPEGFVIFDNVFVPNERIFLDGETAHAATLAHSLGLWERAAGLGDAGEHADREVGMAALLAEANGVADDPRIKDQLANLVVYATMCRAAGEAAMVNATKTDDGNMLPSPLFVSALKYFKSEFRAKLLDIQHDIAGDQLVNAPTVADFENPELHGALEAAFAAPGFSAEDRLRLFHYVRDTTADAYGGWAFVNGQLAGGGQHAQRIVTMRQYDMEHAKAIARRAVGIGEYARKGDEVTKAISI